MGCACVVGAFFFLPAFAACRPTPTIQTDPVRLTQRMQFQWTSALNTQALTEFKTQEVWQNRWMYRLLCTITDFRFDLIVHQVFIFEMAMVLATKALAHINQVIFDSF